MASYTVEEYARSLLGLSGSALDGLAADLDTGRYPGESDWPFRLRLRELLPPDDRLLWDGWIPEVRPHELHTPSKGPSIWDLL